MYNEFHGCSRAGKNISMCIQGSNCTGLADMGQKTCGKGTLFNYLAADCTDKKAIHVVFKNPGGSFLSEHDIFNFKVWGTKKNVIGNTNPTGSLDGWGPPR